MAWRATNPTKHMVEDREREPKGVLIFTAGNGKLVWTMTAEKLAGLNVLVVGQTCGNDSTTG